MKRTTSLIVLSAILLTIQYLFCLGGDKILVVFKNEEGQSTYHQLDVVTGERSPVPDNQPIKIRGVVVDSSFMTGSSPPPPPSPGPADDPVAEKAYNLAASIGNRQDAYNIGSFYQFFANLLKDGKATDKQIRDSFITARKLAATTTANWDSVFKSLDADMAKATDLQKWMNSVAKGFLSYVGADPDKVLQSAEVAFANSPDKIVVTQVFTWIKIILTILKAFGIDVGELPW